MGDILPEWLIPILGDNLVDKLDYITNGKHLKWYASFRYTIGAAIMGGMVALILGILGAGMRRSSFLPFKAIGVFYTSIVRGVPDILFFIFFPLAFEQGMEFIFAQSACSPADWAVANKWPPCDAAQWYLSTSEYFILASVSLGIVYGAFCANVIHGALSAVPHGQLEAARAFGMTKRQIFIHIHIPQMWVYALPGLSNVWILLVKATSLLSLLQIADIVLWAERLGAPNFISQVGHVHPDWRWRYYFVLFIFYIIVTILSEKFFEHLQRRASKGMAISGQKNG